MDILQAIAAASNSLNILRTMQGVAANIDSMARVADAQAALINVQSEVLSIQSKALALQMENGELKSQLAKHDLKVRYELFRTAKNHYVYKLRPESGGTEHSACPTGMEAGVLHVLQGPNRREQLQCKECGAIYYLNEPPPESDPCAGFRSDSWVNSRRG